MEHTEVLKRIDELERKIVRLPSGSILSKKQG